MDMYKFEASNPSYGSEADVKADTKVFKSRLFISDDATNLDKVDEGLLRRFVIANHRAADWYNQARDKRRESKKNYEKGRIALLAIIPIGVLAITFIPGIEADAAIIPALLTGIIAAVRASSVWMEAKFAASNFASAASLLKERIYAFENEWRGKDLSEEIQAKAFNQALEDGVKEAREIAKKQRQDYFTNSAPPSINIMQSLAAAKIDAAALLKSYQSPKLTQALKDQEEEIAARKLNTQGLIETTRITALINARSQLIKEKELLLSTEQDENRKQYLKSFIKTLLASQQADEVTLLKKTAELAAMNVNN